MYIINVDGVEFARRNTFSGATSFARHQGGLLGSNYYLGSIEVACDNSKFKEIYIHKVSGKRVEISAERVPTQDEIDLARWRTLQKHGGPWNVSSATTWDEFVTDVDKLT